MYFFDETINAFLVEGIHNIPESAVAVSEAEYDDLIAKRDSGCVLYVSDSKVKATPPRPSAEYDWDGKKWIISKDKLTALLDEQRETIREKINALRDEKINGGVWIEAINKWIDSDATAERNLLSVKATFDLMGDSIPAIEWTCADNSQIMLTKDKLLAIWQALLEAKTHNHANALKHKAAMEKAKNPFEYDFSTDWTKTYQDFLQEQQND
ncbi:DUF4376 domain-containing protein [Rodentibacter myodis]|uniref:Phage tail protein n=1 Tax=Rodentibacter myodis TaxID=1907939 RepID=A0A1V3JQ37_9PAST|nr:DUF4376 domain-containing protein [Rodentibacter myodis]OOF58932.1 phage tail protein [Rodentibacter myodis]